MSEKCHKQTRAPINSSRLFNNFVGACQQRRRHVEVKRLRCFQVDHGYELGWRLHRKFGRIGSSKNKVDIRCRLP